MFYILFNVLILNKGLLYCTVQTPFPQDTLVALEALTAWSAAQPPAPAHLNVTVRAGGAVASAMLTPDIKVPEVMKIGLGKLDVAVEGKACF